ncbi:hypothetical protein P7C73_g6840, partial [Tremellales sp. Uapishka_1]
MQEVEKVTSETYNFTLVNYYASGTDSISYHSDGEAFLPPEPCIASLSLGGTRDFMLRHKAHKQLGLPVEKFILGDGDMVVMRGRTQREWEHAIPKRAKADGRINVTFRKAVKAGGTENYYRYNVGQGPVYRWRGGKMQHGVRSVHRRDDISTTGFPPQPTPVDPSTPALTSTRPAFPADVSTALPAQIYTAHPTPIPTGLPALIPASLLALIPAPLPARVSTRISTTLSRQIHASSSPTPLPTLIPAPSVRTLVFPPPLSVSIPTLSPALPLRASRPYALQSPLEQFHYHTQFRLVHANHLRRSSQHHLAVWVILDDAEMWLAWKAAHELDGRG